jgi:hypothetical protein
MSQIVSSSPVLVPVPVPVPLPVGVLAMLFVVALATGLPAMGTLHSREVYTHRNVSGGYELDEAVYFLVDYGLYRAPRGIARFPDGGRARYILKEVILCRADLRDSSVTSVARLVSGDVPGRNVKNSYFGEQEDLLMIVFQATHGSRDDPEAWHAVQLDTVTGGVTELGRSTPAELLERTNFQGERRVSITETIALLDRATLHGLGLPSPLDYMDRSERQYREDLVELRGDGGYRRAIIEAIAKGDIQADPDEILRRIEAKKSSLEEPYRSLYELRIVEVVEPLRALRE